MSVYRMVNFTPVSALLGGLLIGAAAWLLLFLNGRIAGISGILGGLVSWRRGDAAWQALFLIGLVLGALAYRLLDSAAAQITVTNSWPLLIAGGLIVGFGTRLGNGCTSGHGVCGLARLSGRSLAATLCFMVSGGVTVYVIRHVLGS
jgi:uncharacterized membrane protein YedE/YeeE